MKRDYEQELGVAMRAAFKAQKVILDVYFGEGPEVHTKADSTLVTNADLAANAIILEELSRAFPDDAIVSEEDKDVQGGRTWYVDPIDGTKGFTYRSDQFAVHIGLAEEERVVLGVVHKPTTGETYLGVKGQGAFRINPNLREVRLRVSKTNTGRLIQGRSFGYRDTTPSLLEALGYKTVHSSGSQGLRMMKVAEGSADANFSEIVGRCNTWDLCAPQIIVEEAGGWVGYTDGSPILYQGQRSLDKAWVVARNGELGQRIGKTLDRML
jgi:3'(2'), 5'-bisphosphate nucleotidase